MISVSQTRLDPARMQRGMTLIEVLVTVVLISVGLLGIAALQMTSLRNNQEAYFRSQASVLAGDILDRMRANSIAARTGQYNVSFGSAEDEEADAESEGEGEEEEAGGGTTATRDVAAWQAEIARLLPNGEGQIQSNGNVVTIAIRWNERPQASSAEGDEAEDLRLPTFQTRSEI